MLGRLLSLFAALMLANAPASAYAPEPEIARPALLAAGPKTAPRGVEPKAEPAAKEKSGASVCRVWEIWFPPLKLASSMGYTGYYADAESGDYYAQQRYYRAGVGRFLSVDPWEGDTSNPVTLNKYLYANGNPLIYIDPDGRQSMSPEVALSYAASLQRPEEREQFQLRAAAYMERYNAESAGAATAVQELVTESVLGLAELAGDMALAQAENTSFGVVDLGGRRALQARSDALRDFISNDPLGTVVRTLEARENAAQARFDAGEYGEASRIRTKTGLEVVSSAAGGVGALRGAVIAANRVVGRVPSPIDAVTVTEDAARLDVSIIGPTIGKSGYGSWPEFNAEAYRRYQRYVDEAYDAGLAAEREGLLKGNRSTRVGDFVDRQSRTRLDQWLAFERIPEGPEGSVQLNRWLRDPGGTGQYVRPDVRLPGLMLDATVGRKPPGTRQLHRFDEFSEGTPTTIVRPTQLGGSYTVLPGGR